MLKNPGGPPSSKNRPPTRRQEEKENFASPYKFLPKSGKDKSPSWGEMIHTELLRYGIDDSQLDTAPIKELLPKLLSNEIREDTTLAMEASDLLVWLAKHRSEEFSVEYAALLDFNDPKSFHHTGGLLSSLRGLHWGTKGDEYDEMELILNDDLETTNPQRYKELRRGSKAIEQVLGDAVGKKTGSYVLNQYAQSLLREMQPKRGEGIKPGKSWGYILLSEPDETFAYEHGRLLLSEPNQYETVRNILGSYRSNRDLAVEENAYENLGFEKYQKLIDTIAKQGQQLASLCTRPLIADQLIFQKPGEPVDALEKAGFLRDYQFIVQPEIREAIEKDFDIKLPVLSMREQFYFLAFLRDQPMEAATSLQEFVKQFDVNGLRTFLVNEYDEQMSERILTFATITDSEVVKDVFSKYAQVLDNAATLQKGLEEALDDDFQKLPSELFEAFVRRSAHLFFAAEQMSTWKYDTETKFKGETMHDLQEAFAGIALLTEVLSDIKAQQKFTFAADVAKTKDGNFQFKVEDKATHTTYGLKIFIRPKEERIMRGKRTPDEQVEQRLEARINVELSLDELPADNPLRKAFFNQTKHHRDNKSVESSVIRFGFDLDTAHEPPQLSFDMGRNAREGTLQSRTGDVLGNILARVGPEGHHLTHSFSREFSEPERFARVAQSLQKYLTKLSKER